MPRVDELPQHDVTLRLSPDERTLVARTLRHDLDKTRERTTKRGEFQREPGARDLQDIRARTLEAVIKALEEADEDVTIPYFAWWYVGSALRSRARSIEFMGRRVDKVLDQVDELISQNEFTNT